jgi:hypothetical protein
MSGLTSDEGAYSGFSVVPSGVFPRFHIGVQPRERLKVLTNSDTQAAMGGGRRRLAPRQRFCCNDTKPPVLIIMALILFGKSE